MNTELTPNTIKDIFTHLHLMSIQGEPNYESLMLLQVELNANAASVYTALSALGYLALTVPPAVFTRENITAWVPPPNPGPTPPVLGNNATQAQIAQANRLHQAQIKEWKNYNMTKKV